MQLKHSYEFVRIKYFYYFSNGIHISIGLSQNPITYDKDEKHSGKTHADLVDNKEILFKQTLKMTDEMVQRDVMGMDCDGGYSTSKASVQHLMKIEYNLNDMFVESDDAAHLIERVIKQVACLFRL